MTGLTLRRALKVEGWLLLTVLVTGIGTGIAGPGTAFSVIGPLALLFAALGVPVLAGMLIARAVTVSRQRREQRGIWGER